MRKIYEVYIDEEFYTYTYQANTGRMRAKKENPKGKIHILEKRVATSSYRETLSVKSQLMNKRINIRKRTGVVPSSFVVNYASTFNCSKEEEGVLILALHEAERWGDLV